MTRKLNIYFTLISLFNLLFFISFSAISAEAENKVQACSQALDKGDIESAITIAETILKQEPKHREGLLCKGRALGAKGSYAESLATLEMAASQAQTGFEQIVSHLLIGNLHSANNKNTEAIASYTKSLQLSEAGNNQKFARINHHLLAEVYTQNNDLNAALVSNLAGAKLAMNDNERADSFERLAATYSALNQHDSAIEYQLKAALMQQKSGTLDQYANASLVLGEIFEKAKDAAGAEKTYVRLIKFSKDNGGAYYEAKASFALAKLKASNGQQDAANTLFGEAYSVASKAGEKQLADEIETAMNQLKK